MDKKNMTKNKNPNGNDVQAMLRREYKLKGEALAKISQKIKQRKVKRRQFLLSEGDVCSRYWYVQNGLFRTFHVDENGKEHNLAFAAEGNWVTDVGSFHSEKPSRLYIEALEESTVYEFEKPDLIDCYINYPTFDRRFRVTVENQFIELQNRFLQILSISAEKRYKAFLKDYPAFVQRLTNVQIASYIGITPEFLSKLRARKS